MRTFGSVRTTSILAGAVALLLGGPSQVHAAEGQVIQFMRGGTGYWAPDPWNGDPGDAIRACDNTTDGKGVEVTLDIHRDGSIDRVATTRGYNAGYCSPWKTGNLKEGTLVRVKFMVVKGGTVYESHSYDGVA
ncbi:hypothetical protein [Streptomyces albidoflavus]|uniref:hypothetical protein n=1 Tax=Streptomyces albidoflavus TaxID=1886 RepID=UPI0033C5ED22